MGNIFNRIRRRTISLDVPAIAQIPLEIPTLETPEQESEGTSSRHQTAAHETASEFGFGELWQADSVNPITRRSPSPSHEIHLPPRFFRSVSSLDLAVFKAQETIKNIYRDYESKFDIGIIKSEDFYYFILDGEKYCLDAIEGHEIFYKFTDKAMRVMDADFYKKIYEFEEDFLKQINQNQKYEEEIQTLHYISTNYGIEAVSQNDNGYEIFLDNEKYYFNHNSKKLFKQDDVYKTAILEKDFYDKIAKLRNNFLLRSIKAGNVEAVNILLIQGANPFYESTADISANIRHTDNVEILNLIEDNKIYAIARNTKKEEAKEIKQEKFIQIFEQPNQKECQLLIQKLLGTANLLTPQVMMEMLGHSDKILNDSEKTLLYKLFCNADFSSFDAPEKFAQKKYLTEFEQKSAQIISALYNIFNEKNIDKLREAFDLSYQEEPMSAQEDLFDENPEVIQGADKAVPHRNIKNSGAIQMQHSSLQPTF